MATIRLVCTLILILLSNVIYSEEIIGYDEAKTIIDSKSITMDELNNSERVILLQIENKNNIAQAMTYLALLYDRKSGISDQKTERIFWDKKSSLQFDKTISSYPKYAFVYAARGLSLFFAPDYLKKHKKSMYHFEKALSIVKSKHRKDRMADDWESYAYIKKFYPLLLNKLIEKDIEVDRATKKIEELKNL